MPFYEHSISARQLCKGYQESGREHIIFKNLNLEVRQGEFVVILGRSGSGKSTLLNLFSGIDRPTSGELFINGFNLGSLSEHHLTLFRRHHIGFVYQSYNLIQTLTVIENLLLPLELLDTTPLWQCREKALKLLDQLGLSERMDTYPDRLSGGEQQRVAIARALIHNPTLILADEPTGNLDLQTGKEVLSLLDDMVRKAGKTMIMATHSREVIGMADRILTIRDQKLIRLDDGPCLPF
ncbi:MAG: ABC transporter ATP-binding protein [Gammaproteobacteria bacterium]